MKNTLIYGLTGSLVIALSTLNGCGDDSQDLDEHDEAGSHADSGTVKDAGDEPADKDAGKEQPKAGSTAPKPTFDGEPIEAADGTWTYIEFADSKCRDGSAAGIVVNPQSDSKKLMIFLQGGGACFDGLTCATNPASVAGQTQGVNSGILDRTNDENPVQDWNYVFVPYCTGDVHGGTNDEGMVEGVAGVQHFVGRRNMEKFLNRIVPTFADAEQVLLTGVSAGGFGSAISGELVQDAFGEVPVVVVDDSGPPMTAEFLPECLQQKWRETWGFDDSFLKDCGEDCPNPNDYSIDYLKHLSSRFPEQLSGLIETTGDSVITGFYGYGLNDCTGSFLTPVPVATFTAGLLDFREKVSAETDNYGTYYIEGTEHTWLAGASFYTQETGGVRMVDWVADIIDGTGTSHVGP